ncbi:MAG TPA: hypothetical protein VFL79_04240, partial [Terriglobia bacterium]|nr:hypothetical protein [Terriglobia bacterium]
WENTWASFDDYTVGAFRKETGLDARKDVKLGDFSDPNFRKWVDFRIKTMTDFLHEIAENAKSVNRNIKIIPEIYPGIEEEAVRVGADPYQIYPVVDAIAHEYEFGEGDHTAAARTPLTWFHYQVGIASFRAFAEGKPTWILNYSWDGNKGVDPKQAMQNLAMSELMAGANVWDARGHVMSGSNDLPTRVKIFSWIKEHEKVFYDPRTPMHPIGVYFSPASRNYFVNDFLPSYEGVLILLIQSHLEYQVVTPRTVAEFHGTTLVLPNVQVLGDSEKETLKKFVGRGGRVVVTGTDVTGFGNSPQVIRLPSRPGQRYMSSLEKGFGATTPESEHEFLQSLPAAQDLVVKASPSVATQIAVVDGQPHVFFANFKGLVANKNPVQTPEAGVQITVKGRGKAHFLPFLGSEQELTGKSDGDRKTYTLPPITKGAVAWFDSAAN